MRKLSLLFICLIILGSCLLPFLSLNAQDDTSYGLTATAERAGLKRDIDVPTYLGMIAGAALAMAGSIFLFLIIYGGVMIMTSAGSDRVEKGKKIITWAVIGAIVLGASYAITSFIFSALTTTSTQ